MSTPTQPSTPAQSTPAPAETPAAQPKREIKPIPDPAIRGEHGHFAPKPGLPGSGDRLRARSGEEVIPGVAADEGIEAVEQYVRKVSGEKPDDGEEGKADKAKPKPAAKSAASTAPAPADEAAPAPTADPTPDEGKQAAAPTDPASPTPGFRIANKTGKALEWKDETEAFDNISALRGMHGKLQADVKKMQEVAAHNYTYATTAQQRVQELERELAGYRAGGQTPNSQAAQPQAGQSGSANSPADAFQAFDEAKGIIEQSVDWDIYKQFRQTHGVEHATLWATEVALRKLREQHKRELQAALSPLSETAERANITQEATRLFQTVASYERPGGGRVYPELQDPAATREILDVWANAPITDDAKLKPAGVHLAVVTWRDWRQSQGRPWSANGQSSSPAGAPPLAANGAGQTNPNDPAAVAREIVTQIMEANGQSSETPVGEGQGLRGNSPRANREQRIKTKLRETKLADEELGFSL